MRVQRVDGGLRFVLCLSLVGVATACVSSPEVKQASSELTTIYGSLTGAEGTFRRAFLAEIARTRSDLEAAIVARAVKAKVDQLAEVERKGNLIALSGDIEKEQQAMRSFLADVRTVARKQAKANDELTGADFLAGYKAAVIQERMETAAELDKNGLKDAAADLRANAKQFPDAATLEDVQATFELIQTERIVKRNLEDFQVVVRALQEMHATIDQWIVTDVNVSGAQVAELVSRANAVLQ